jgi:hypothetical protein
MLAELRETPAQAMRAELRVTPVREIRMAGKQRRLAEVNHLRPRGISYNLGRRGNISESRSMFSNLRTSVKAMTDMMMETRPWHELDTTEWMGRWDLG